jgi:hypothetical protein
MSFKTPLAFSKSDLLKGFKTLNQLWNKNLVPEDLERHYFLYWFVVYKGNIIQTAQALQIHRNTIQWHFLNFGFANKTVLLRHSWRKMTEKNKKVSFESNFLKFYLKFAGGTKLTVEENKFLVALWKTQFSFKTLGAHYLLWALRTGKTKEWVQDKLNYSSRHRLRRLTSMLDSKTRDGFWLSTLKPSFREVYSSRYRNIISKKSKGNMKRI